MTFMRPLGVIAAIIPWKVPAYFFISKMALFFAAGNIIVIKSNDKAPLTVRTLCDYSSPRVLIQFYIQ
jgi:acyl-CoA reductase-like NAD-dependent aldehyde dehydrogenase